MTVDIKCMVCGEVYEEVESPPSECRNCGNVDVNKWSRTPPSISEDEKEKLREFLDNNEITEESDVSDISKSDLKVGDRIEKDGESFVVISEYKKVRDDITDGKKIDKSCSTCFYEDIDKTDRHHRCRLCLRNKKFEDLWLPKEGT